MEEIKKIDLEDLNPTELETVTNYVLYGKDEEGLSVVDRKEVFIKTKFNSYTKKRTVSLDEMMENPAFDENVLSKEKTIYKKIKPSIDKAKAEKIPDMVQLWKTIDTYQEKLNELKKLTNPSSEQRKEIYYLNHWLIGLRTQQYYIMDSFYPVSVGHKNKSQYFESKASSHVSYPVLPRGVMKSKQDLHFISPRKCKEGPEIHIYTDDEIKDLKIKKKPFFDFRNTEHLYQLIQHYQEIQEYVKNIPDSMLNNLLLTLDFYIEKANLSPQQELIIQGKKLRLANKQIAQNLIDELGISHQENYVSTIWNKTIKQIADAVELNYDEYLCRNYDKAWKVCNRCGKEYLRDPRNFVRKTKSADGLTNRCKMCDKELRQCR